MLLHFCFKEHNSNQKMNSFNFFPIKNLRDQIRLWHKIGHEQPRVTIYINLKGLTPKVLHTKFQGNRHNCFGEEDF